MGARQLPVRGLRKEWVGGAAGALTAAGLFVVVIEMAQIHPNQQLYFNFLTDRKTPERLYTRYKMDSWNMMARQGYEYLLRQTPAGAINIKRKHLISMARGNLSPMIFPAADRRRLAHDLSRDPDFYLAYGSVAQRLHQGQPEDRFPPVLHRFKVYNNTIMTVSTPDLSWVDPAVADAYRAVHRVATAGAPVARGGGFDAYRHGQRLAWVKEACEPEALMREFRLYLYPADAGHLLDYQQKRGYFELIARGVRLDGKCVGMARLPDFALARVRLGQPGRWEVEVPF